MLKIDNKTLPGLYKSSNRASLDAQSNYFFGLKSYLILLIIAALISFLWPKDVIVAILSAILFLITLFILIVLKYFKPDDRWYNGRAVAESVKTRSWRWAMRAEPYQDCLNVEIVSKQFINDLKSILQQNRSLSESLPTEEGLQAPISSTMSEIRGLSTTERLEIYKEQRIDDQAKWYSLKFIENKKKARNLFIVSIILHSIAILMLLYRIKNPLMELPIEVLATAAGAVLTWLQAKKHNELISSYSLAAHEIVLIKGEALSIRTEEELSTFVLDSENAFSREHTQWTARKTD
ncbi:MAG: DUF4231 domain-containing protein [Sulfurospirillum sp.]|nr:DUF4231 domain-containing protein [Sulfurospirillum sp.]